MVPISAITIGQIDFQASIWRLITDGSLLIEGLEINERFDHPKAPFQVPLTPHPYRTDNAGTDPWQETLQALPDLLLGYFKQVQIERLKCHIRPIPNESQIPYQIGDLSFIEVACKTTRLSAELEGQWRSTVRRRSLPGTEAHRLTCPLNDSPSPTITLSGEINGTVDTHRFKSDNAQSSRYTTAWKPAEKLDLSILARRVWGSSVLHGSG